VVSLTGKGYLSEEREGKNEKKGKQREERRGLRKD